MTSTKEESGRGVIGWLLLAGIAVGWLVGLSDSPVVAGVVTSLLAFIISLHGLLLLLVRNGNEDLFDIRAGMEAGKRAEPDRPETSTGDKSAPSAAGGTSGESDLQSASVSVTRCKSNATTSSDQSEPHSPSLVENDALERTSPAKVRTNEEAPDTNAIISSSDGISHANEEAHTSVAGQSKADLIERPTQEESAAASRFPRRQSRFARGSTLVVAPAAVIVLGVAIGATTGLVARTHNWFGKDATPTSQARPGALKTSVTVDELKRMREAPDSALFNLMATSSNDVVAAFANDCKDNSKGDYQKCLRAAVEHLLTSSE